MMPAVSSKPLNSEQKKFKDSWVSVPPAAGSAESHYSVFTDQFLQKEVKPCGLIKSSSSILHTWSWITLLWKEAYYQQGCTWDVSKNWAGKFHADHLTGNEFHRLRGRSPLLGNTQTLFWDAAGLSGAAWAVDARGHVGGDVYHRLTWLTSCWEQSSCAYETEALVIQTEVWHAREQDKTGWERIKEHDQEQRSE